LQSTGNTATNSALIRKYLKTQGIRTPAEIELATSLIDKKANCVTGLADNHIHKLHDDIGLFK
jgi:hypothetical protein